MFFQEFHVSGSSSVAPHTFGAASWTRLLLCLPAMSIEWHRDGSLGFIKSEGQAILSLLGYLWQEERVVFPKLPSSDSLRFIEVKK